MALTLASVGIYSVLSYIVRGRSREIGIRTALGASTGGRRAAGGDRRDDAGARSASPPASVASLASARLLQKVVFGVSAWDPLTLAAVAVGLTVVALVATLVPAYRASRVDPLIVLRSS